MVSKYLPNRKTILTSSGSVGDLRPFMAVTVEARLSEEVDAMLDEEVAAEVDEEVDAKVDIV